MASYWIYLNGDVTGPFEVEQLIRLRGFSRTTQVCREDGSGQPGNWTSPAEIPELARIFKSVDEFQDLPAPTRPAQKPAPSRVPPRPVPRPAAASAPAVAAAPAKKSQSGVWALRSLVALITIALIGAGIWWFQQSRQQAQSQERHSVQNLIETTQLPSGSQYATLRQCLQERRIEPQWDFEPTADGVYHATLSWFTEPYGSVPGSAVYAFEVNLPAQNIRGLNTAASRLLAEGFVGAAATHKPTSAVKMPSPSGQFQSSLATRNKALQDGDFDAVWSAFSQRKRSEMIQAGISQSGFVRLQSLTHRLEAGLTLSVLKTKDDGPSRRLVLLRQSQDKHPDVFLKQQWVLESGQWKLDDEEKHSTGEPQAVAAPISPAATEKSPSAVLPEPEAAPANTSAEAAVSAPTAAPAATPAPSPAENTASPEKRITVPVQSLPGLSN